MHDVLIIGGGLVGNSLACALAREGLRVGLVEATAGGPAAGDAPPAFDERNLALAEASLNALGALGVLAHLRSPPAPIRRIHVSRRGDFGAVRLDAREQGREAFGGVVIARELGAALEAAVGALPTVERIRPMRLVALAQGPEAVDVRLDGPQGERRLQARLLVAADGTESGVRAQAGIDVDRHDYGQTLFVSSVAPARAPDGQAFERFTDTGPIALLPRPDGHYGGVMGVDREAAGAVAALSDEAYLERFAARFGGRAGRLLRVGRRQAYPIQRVVARQLVAGRVVVVGNAAQTLHPIGAQGFNLGLRDALTLAEVVAAGRADPGHAEVLAAYPRRRRDDREATLSFSDGLARLTANEGFAPHLLRSLGLLALQRWPGLKARLAAGAMGYRGDVPALSRGEPWR